jgi:hypothetical protein
VRQKFVGLPSPDLVSSVGSEPGASEVWLFGHLKEKLRQLTKQDDTVFYHMKRIVLNFKVGAKPEHESVATHYSNAILRFHNLCLDLDKVAEHEARQKGPGSELKPSTLVAMAKTNEPRDAFLRAQGHRVTLKDLVCGPQDDPLSVIEAALRACAQLEETALAAHVELQRVQPIHEPGVAFGVEVSDNEDEEGDDEEDEGDEKEQAAEKKRPSKSRSPSNSPEAEGLQAQAERRVLTRQWEAKHAASEATLAALSQRESDLEEALQLVSEAQAAAVRLEQGGDGATGGLAMRDRVNPCDYNGEPIPFRSTRLLCLSDKEKAAIFLASAPKMWKIMFKRLHYPTSSLEDLLVCFRTADRLMQEVRPSAKPANGAAKKASQGAGKQQPKQQQPKQQQPKPQGQIKYSPKGGARDGGGGGGGGGGGVCFSFQKDGTCKYGNNCKFSHGNKAHLAPRGGKRDTQSVSNIEGEGIPPLEEMNVLDVAEGEKEEPIELTKSQKRKNRATNVAKRKEGENRQLQAAETEAAAEVEALKAVEAVSFNVNVSEQPASVAPVRLLTAKQRDAARSSAPRVAKGSHEEMNEHELRLMQALSDAEGLDKSWEQDETPSGQMNALSAFSPMGVLNLGEMMDAQLECFAPKAQPQSAETPQETFQRFQLASFGAGLLMVDVVIGGVLVRALLDTGAAINACRKDVFETIKASMEKKGETLRERRSNLSVVSACTTTSTSCGVVEVPVSLHTGDGKHVTAPIAMTVEILHRLNHPFIFGMKGMGKHALQINTAERKVFRVTKEGNLRAVPLAMASRDKDTRSAMSALPFTPHTDKQVNAMKVIIHNVPLQYMDPIEPLSKSLLGQEDRGQPLSEANVSHASLHKVKRLLGQEDRGQQLAEASGVSASQTGRAVRARTARSGEVPLPGGQVLLTNASIRKVKKQPLEESNSDRNARQKKAVQERQLLKRAKEDRAKRNQRRNARRKSLRKRRALEKGNLPPLPAQECSGGAEPGSDRGVAVLLFTTALMSLCPDFLEESAGDSVCSEDSESESSETQPELGESTDEATERSTSESSVALRALSSV